MALLDVEDRDLHRVLFSTLPMRTPAEEGEKRPIDLRLEDHGDFMAPANGLVRLKLSKRIGAGLDLSSSGVSVRPGALADADARAEVVRDRLFWSNVAEDTDFMAVPLPDGVQTFHQLRSAASPERLPLVFGLPEGAELRASGPGGAEVVADDGRVVDIRPPIAFDADGEDVPVEYEVNGNVLALRVAHRERDVAYPLLVDPAITEDQTFWESGYPSFAGWAFRESHPGSFSHVAGDSLWGRGLATWLRANQWYPNLSWGMWQFRAPGDSYVSAAEFWEMDVVAAGGHACVVQGFWADTGWNSGSQSSLNYPGGGASPWMSCATPATAMHRAHRVGVATRNNTAALQLFVNGDGSRAFNDVVFLGGAVTTIEDDRAPDWLQQTMPTSWTSATSGTYRFKAHDNGLGILDMELEGREPGGEWWPEWYWEPTCDGYADARCAPERTHDQHVELPVGSTEWKLSAWDPVGNVGSIQWTSRVDPIEPWINVHGALRDLEGKTVAQDTKLVAEAFEDPYPDVPGADRSGVRSLELLVDGQRHEYQEQPCDQNCNMTRELTLRVGAVTAAEHTVKVVARDGAGNVASSEEWKLTVGAGTVAEPIQGMRVPRRLPLQAAVGTGVTGVAWQYRLKSVDPWTAVPAAAMRDEQNNGVTLTNGNLPIVDGKSKFVTWDLPATLGATPDGPLEVRASFTGGLGGSSAAVTAFLDRKGLGTRTAREDLGPGEVDLLTGNFNLSETDVGIDAFRTDLTVARAYNSRDAGSIGPLGPGWTFSTPVTESMEFAKLVEAADSPVVQVVGSDGSRISFTKRSWGYEPERGHEGFELRYISTAPAAYVLADGAGNETTFRKTGTEWTVANVEIQGAGPRTRTEMTWSNGKLQSINAPNANASTDCGGQKALACRTLTFAYASSTTATATSPGDYAGRLSTIEFTAYDPVARDVVTDAVARYQYDTAGRLVATWDPRISPALKTTYQYDADNLLTRVTPPGEQPWTLQYQPLAGELSGNGRLKSVTRSALSAGTAAWTVVYGVPVSGTGAPYAMGATQIATGWGQKDVPTDATAIFPPDHVPPSAPTDFSRATISYLNRKGEEVNSAAPGGHITTTEHDEYGNVVRELSAANRVLAGGSATRAAELDVQRRYESTGQRMTDEIGPLHEVELANGSVAQARAHTRIRYDEGAPSQDLHLPTTVTVSAKLADGTEADERVTKTKYDWTWRVPTEVVEDAGEGRLNLTHRTLLEGEHGFEVERRMPKRPEGGDASAVRTIYYTSTTNADHRECGDRPEWYMLPCKVVPVSQPGTAGLPDLAVTTYQYNRLLQVTQTKETTGTHSRTATTTYDAAGREVSDGATATSGTAVPTATTAYSDATGHPTSVTTVDGGVTRRVTTTYDTLGRPTSYTDAEGNTSTTTYDLLSRPLSRSDGKGTQTLTYDATSGLPTRLEDSGAGVFTASYNADGLPLTTTLPGGVKVTNTYDETGEAVGRRYDGPGACGASCMWFDETVGESAHGQVITRASNLSSQRYTYDGAGRLVQVRDTAAGGPCVTRTYQYDRNSNRTALTARGAGPTGICNGAASATTTSYTHDAADRIVDSGYTYDAFGRTMTVPARNANGGTLTSTYYVNDLVRSQTQDGRTNTYALDPLRRERVKTVSGTSSRTETSHYADDSDAPAWTQDAGTLRWRRYVSGIGGDLVAIVDSTSGVTLQLTNLHGDVVGEATIGSGGSAVLGATFETDEFGVPKTNDGRTYGWLGAKERSKELPSGVVQMGVRSYVPTLGRFLQVDPVVGGSANAYDYAYQDPVNITDLDGRCPWCAVAA
ncbi:MAG TPA: RHS repeat-associated core domain-containing protein, partial [Actinomycetota bacterium]|nr:RHS repeat-associated core domain-containing protein [Actinomycetota bacterium]